VTGQPAGSGKTAGPGPAAGGGQAKPGTAGATKLLPVAPPQPAPGVDPKEVERLRQDYETKLRAMQQELDKERSRPRPEEETKPVEPAAAAPRAPEKAQAAAAAPPTPAQPQPAPQVPAAPPEPQVQAMPEVAEGAAVDHPPQPTQRAKPSYPPAARRMKLAGRVIVSVLVGENGEVLQAKVIRSDSELLSGAALDAARDWRFIPASRGGQPVQSWYTLPPFDFKP
jgi:protein TonB